MLDKQPYYVTMECPVNNWDNFVTHHIEHNDLLPVAALRTEDYLYVTFKGYVFSLVF